jgi:hypothetical protein
VVLSLSLCSAARAPSIKPGDLLVHVGRVDLQWMFGDGSSRTVRSLACWVAFALSVLTLRCGVVWCALRCGDALCRTSC